MAMSAGGHVSESPGWLAPIGWVGRTATGTLSYLGATALLTLSAGAAIVRGRDDDETTLRAATTHELSWMLWAGFPLVALVHVAMGSFLSMQAYFGSTFVDGTGAVVGVGLLRNLASMMTGLTLAGLLPGRIVPELRRLRRGPADLPFGRTAAARMLAAVAATPLLSLWGCVVGTVVGWKSSEALMGLSTDMYFLMLVRMLWYRDVVGVLVKGVLFGLVTSAFACAEGLRDLEPEADAGDEAVATMSSVVRASCLAMAAILLLNMTWFLFVYHAVPVYGPSLLQPPTP
ncbi:ABC transporter permease [Paludisphaera mucosa]|uniref:ABC transporter permease n=1 Tax=Paludisphaera mucosa TaxID=3030827 RepID=A0ABT6FAW9_9BACT|nr:ABC transporter permease [Paludisphaera mucosa]MDG3004733.1 ABC transporter permease [Paludisphaera mucosa]